MKMTVSILLAAMMLTMLFAIVGCKKEEPTAPPPEPNAAAPAHEHEHEAAVTTEQAAAAAAQTEQTMCPVMDGNKINKDVFVVYQGKKVYFCCPACKGVFEKNPEKYISKLPQFKK